MEKLLSWLVMRILEVLLRRAESAAEEERKRVETERQRKQTDAVNVEKYNQAKTRADEIAAASDILNGIITR